MTGFESVVEDAAIEYLRELGYAYVHGPDIAPDGPSPERDSYADVVLAGRLRSALARINPDLDADVLDGVAKRVLRPEEGKRGPGVSEILCMGGRTEKVRKPCPDEHRQ